ncbi:hypothetical protein MASR1M32_19430 [Rhodobacter sp.]
MLYWLADFGDTGGFFNLFRYITFRAGGAFATALIFGFLFGRPLIDLCAESRARVSRSATTARKPISPRPAPPRWAGS